MSTKIRVGRRCGLTVWCLLASLTLTACGGGGGGNDGGSGQDPTPPPPPPPPVPKVSLSGGGIKGPLAYAPLAFYEFDASRSDYQAVDPVATGLTNSQAGFDGVLVPAPNPPYFLVFTTNQNTFDLTTNTAPVITTMKTVVTADMLSQGYPIYATPLTTVAVELAIANAESTQPPYDFPKQANRVDNFLLALPIAARQVTSSLGFGLSEQVDIFRTWPVVGTDSSQAVLQATAEYRVAVEALSTLAYEVAQSAGSTADAVLSALAADLGDGVIDGVDVQGQAIPLLGPTQRALLQNADPGALTIPNSNTLINEVESLLASEAPEIGATADTSALSNGTIQVTVLPAQLNPDRDGDGVLNVEDAFPDDASRDTDTDGDGTADDVYLLDANLRRTGELDSFASDPDDDNDGLSDVAEQGLGTNPLRADSDSDGLLDSIEITALGSTVTIAYGNYAGSYDGSGTDPRAGDSDNDGLLDGIEWAVAGSVVTIFEGDNAGDYTGTGTNPALADSDGDGLNDGDEVDVGSDPLVTDSDGDTIADGLDNCPAVANADQLDSNGDGVGNLCSSDLSGVWQLSMQVTALTWNGCEAGLLNSTTSRYLSISQDAAGNLVAKDPNGGSLNGVITSGSNRFTLSGSSSSVDPTYNTVFSRQLDINARHNLDGSVSGSFVILDTIDGTATCQQDGTLSASFVYQHGGSEDYSGLYALEYIDRVNTLNGAPVQNNGLVQLQFSATDVAMHDPHPGATVLSSSFNPATGVFQISTQHEELMDWNLDGVDDLVRETSMLNGIMLRGVGDNSGAALSFARDIDRAIFYNNDPQSTPLVLQERRQGYGRRVTSSGFNQTLTHPNMDGSLAMVDRIGLHNPPLVVASAQGALRLTVYAGTDTTVTPLCSAEFETNMVVVENYPQSDMASESLRPGAYGYVACDAGAAGTVQSGNVYTLAVIDDQGTPLDTLDDQIVFSLQHTAQATSAAVSIIPERRDLRLDNAAPSQTEVSAHVAIDGYLNPLAAHTLSWADLGASEYRLRFWEYNPVLGMKDHHEVRVSSSTNSVTIPAGVVNSGGYTAIELSARFDDTQAATSAWSSSRHLIVYPTLNGLFNVELTDSASGDELHLQIALQRSLQQAVLCTITHSSMPLDCDSFLMYADWSTDTIGLVLREYSGYLTGTPDDDSILMSLQFNDARSATVNVGDFSGTAQLVTTELVAQTQANADGTQGTVFRLHNPLPLFDNAQLESGSGLVNLDALGTTVQSLWDETDVDTSNDFGDVVQRFWVGNSSDSVPPTVASEWVFDSHAATASNNVLPGGYYAVTLTNQKWSGSQDLRYQVDYMPVDASVVQAPPRSAITVNGVNAGSGDTLASAIDISAQPAFDLGWVSGVADTTGWTLVIRQVDALGAVIPGAEWRSTMMQLGSDVALSNNAGNWSWSNDGSLDMALRLQAGDVVQLQLVTSDTVNGVEGISEPVYLQLGP
jgi:hypothetical protein